jgi:hypothetical protein
MLLIFANVRRLWAGGNKRFFCPNVRPVNEQKINIMNLKNNKESQPEPQHNSDSTADNLQVSPLAQNRLLSAAIPVRVQRKRIKGWKMPENTVYVGRPGKWGNPFKVGEAIWNPKSETISLITPNSVEECVELFEIYMKNGMAKKHTWMYKHLHELKGKNLACFCSLDKPCHADILLKLANG